MNKATNDYLENYVLDGKRWRSFDIGSILVLFAVIIICLQVAVNITHRNDIIKLQEKQLAVIEVVQELALQGYLDAKREHDLNMLNELEDILIDKGSTMPYKDYESLY